MPDEAKKADEQKTAEQDKKTRKLLGIAPTETHHEIPLDGETLRYVARAGVLPLEDPFGEKQAEIFFTSYELEDIKDKSSRPVTFAFNGGPGSASIWLHMGALGPKRVVMREKGWMPAPPYRYETNMNTWLAFSDLVFIDPVGTGFSRATREDLDKSYWGFNGDIESVGEFIRLYLSRYARWQSPLFLAGESYGTTRAAGLAGHLVDKGISFNGIVLISTVLDFPAIRFSLANDMPYQTFVPTYCATAWYHKKLTPELQNRPLADLMAEVKAWAETELALALMKGDRIQGAEREAVAKKLASYTGLDVEYVLGTNLRIEIFHFCKELLRNEKRSVGRLDSRFKGVEALATNEHFEFDPSMVAITPPYTASFNHYVRADLGIDTDLLYETMSKQAIETWEWEKGKLPTTGESLRGAIAKNPYMKVFVAQGYYDLATPHFATEYMLTHMNVDPELRGNVVMTNYEAGHMFYLDTEALAAFRDDIEGFFERSV